jgi:transcriptional regulator with XRE-family HTH domain
MPDSSSSDAQPPAPVGRTLAKWRKRRNLTGQALADRVGMTQSKISRLETGAVAAEPADVRLLAEALEMPSGEVEHVVELAEHAADNRLIEWIAAGHELLALQREIGRMEAAAKELRVFQPAVIPGLMQTSEYARAVMSDSMDEVAAAGLVDSAVEVSEAVSARMQRNQVLHLPDHQFHFLITEQVLRDQVCSAAEMIAQIERMRELAKYPNIDLRIITDGTSLPIPPYHGFVVADEKWVSVDLFTASLKSNGRQLVRAYREAFAALERVGTKDIRGLLDRYQEQYARKLLPESFAS